MNKPTSGGNLSDQDSGDAAWDDQESFDPGAPDPFAVSTGDGDYAVPAMHGSRELMIVESEALKLKAFDKIPQRKRCRRHAVSYDAAAKPTWAAVGGRWAQPGQTLGSVEFTVCP